MKYSNPITFDFYTVPDNGLTQKCFSLHIKVIIIQQNWKKPAQTANQI